MYDTYAWVETTRQLGITPHVAQKQPCSAIDGRTTRHRGYAVSQRLRKRVEEIFGWMKTIGGVRKLRHRGGARVEWQFLFVAAAYNLVPPPQPAGGSGVTTTQTAAAAAPRPSPHRFSIAMA